MTNFTPPIQMTLRLGDLHRVLGDSFQDFDARRDLTLFAKAP